MGQKSNTITLRTNQKNLSFIESGKNTPSFLHGLKFSTVLEQLLNRKNILLVDSTMNFVSNQCYLCINLFYRTYKLSIYKKKISKVSRRGIELRDKSLNRILMEQLKLLRTNLIILNFQNVNREINDNFYKIIYFKIAKFVGVLFSRRFNLFIDFIKITALFCQDKVPLKTFLFLLGQTFRILQKRKHNQFLFFLKNLFQLLVISSELKQNSAFSNIRGIKFIINGKLQGKTRADSSCIQIGAVPIQSIDKSIEFSRLHVYTLYGVFGFRIWVYRKK